MAEVKNAFIKSKMNKDLDSRLLPSGEYRNAINAQVSRSEGSDVGALENVLGNKQISDFELSVSNLSSIGYLSDEANSIIYVQSRSGVRWHHLAGPVRRLRPVLRGRWECHRTP